MIVLETGDKIQGGATYAAEVDFVISGLDNNVLKQLADGQLADGIGDLYTADSTDVVTNIILVNTGTTANDVNLYLKPSGGTSRRLIAKDLQLEAGYSLHFDGAKVMVLNTSGQIIYVGDKGDQGDVGPKIVSVDWDGDDMEFTLDDASTAVLEDAKIDLKGDQGDPGDMTDLVDDTTPQLGGDLDLNSHDISGVGMIRGKNKEIYKTCSADSPLTAAECSGTIVSNYGMTDADCIIDLPTAAEGLAFVCILPAVRAKYFRLQCPSAQADKIYLSGVAGNDDGYVGVASGYATGASCSMFTFKASDGGYDWFCIPLFGTWVAG